MLRVSVQGGGCSGFQYHFAIDDTALEDDLKLSDGGVTVLIDAMSQEFLQGAVIDWVDDLIGASFQIQTPMPLLPAVAAHLFRSDPCALPAGM